MKKLIPLILIILASTLVLTIIFEVTPVTAADNSELIQVTVDSVDQNGLHLDGAWVNGWTESTPYVFSLTNGGSTNLGVYWGGLPCNPILPAVNKDTTYTIDALSGQVTTQSTPGVNKINVVYEPIQMTVDYVNQNGVHLDGGWNGQSTPAVFTIANGGSTGFGGYWGGLPTVTATMYNLHKDTTYWVDALSGQITTQSTPGVNKINVVYEPIQVTIDTVNQNSIHLNDGYVYGFSNPSPYITTVANGGGLGLYAYWGGLSCYPTLTVINKDTTYSIDAVTGQITTQSSPGVNKINFVFENAAIDTFAITITQGANGLITGPSSADWGTDASYTIVPSIGYHIVSVMVDGVSKGAVASYTISNVRETHTISASFAIDTFAITITQGANGLITGPSSANYGESKAFTITPAAGYGIASITVDGNPVTVTSLTSQTVSLTNIQTSHTITATFGLITSGNKLTTLTGSGNVIIITGGNNNIDATAATDTIVIIMGQGNDQITLGGGNNMVTVTAGSSGNDQITVGNGNNFISVSGVGNYQITAGDGANTIMVNGDGNNQITAGNGGNLVTVNGDGNNKITTGSGIDTITVYGDGNNIIKTGAGNDIANVYGTGNNIIT
jgi:hypothetical protein